MITIDPKCDIALWVPTAFTPNGDSINDNLNIFSLNWKKYELRVFDRWGTLVYHTHDYYKRWNGTFKGELVQMDAYYIQVFVEFKTGETREVHQFVYVLR